MSPAYSALSLVDYSWLTTPQRSSHSKLGLQAYGAWNTAIFILNGVIFILIGLQLPQILATIEGHSFPTLLKYGAIVSVAVIIGRIIWVYPGAYIPRLSRKIREREPEVNLKLVTVVAWSGMRGVVSLAAALALPLDNCRFARFSQPKLNHLPHVFGDILYAGATGIDLKAVIKYLELSKMGASMRLNKRSGFKLPRLSSNTSRKIILWR